MSEGPPAEVPTQRSVSYSGSRAGPPPPGLNPAAKTNASISEVKKMAVLSEKVMVQSRSSYRCFLSNRNLSQNTEARMLSYNAKLQFRSARRTDEATAFYLLAVAVLVLAFREQVPYWLLWLGLHLVGAVFFLRLRSVSHRRIAGQFLHDWYPVVLYPLFFKEVEFLAGAFGYWVSPVGFSLWKQFCSVGSPVST